MLIDTLKPSEIVYQLDKYIIGQSDAKRAVAIALRNRWRRHRLNSDLKYEVLLFLNITIVLTVKILGYAKKHFDGRTNWLWKGI